jgi:hypothetical protein
MQIFTSDHPLIWGKLELPLMGITEDWFGNPLEEPCAFTLVKDPEFLWFISIFSNSVNIHPSASPGLFTPELWKYDVAELFLANPSTGIYLEFNLTANGAWWASEFSSIRKPTTAQPDFISHIRSHQDLSDTNHSVVGLQIPLKILKKEIDFGFTTAANITFICDSPSQRYLSASKLPGVQPDFHQPTNFTTASFIPLHSD